MLTSRITPKGNMLGPHSLVRITSAWLRLLGPSVKSGAEESVFQFGGSFWYGEGPCLWASLGHLHVCYVYYSSVGQSVHSGVGVETALSSTLSLIQLLFTELCTVPGPGVTTPNQTWSLP